LYYNENKLESIIIIFFANSSTTCIFIFMTSFKNSRPPTTKPLYRVIERPNTNCMPPPLQTFTAEQKAVATVPRCCKCKCALTGKWRFVASCVHVWCSACTAHLCSGCGVPSCCTDLVWGMYESLGCWNANSSSAWLCRSCSLRPITKNCNKCGLVYDNFIVLEESAPNGSQ